MTHASNSAMRKPGAPARKNAGRQPNCCANQTSITGATNEPIRLEKKPCDTPIARPLWRGCTSEAIND